MAQGKPVRRAETTVITTVRGVERLKLSNFGNPAWNFATDYGPLRTTPNAQCGYTVDNDFRPGESLDIRAKLYLDEFGFIWKWELQP